MGSDIHAYIDKKHGHYWENFCQLELDRDYKLFGALAGVRGCDIDPVVLPRGMPLHASFTTFDEYKEEGLDAHTPSWLTTEEVFDVTQRVDSNELDVVYEIMSGLNCDCRLIFWFDN